MRHKKLVVIRLPKWLGARGHARRLCANVPEVACDCLVVLEGPDVPPVPDSEFCDELVRVVLTERRAAKLVLNDLPPCMESLLEASAARHYVAHKIDRV
ncbi:MAG: hypothetical protein DYH08_05365 [Actinobacteria bacterium ATB1]|nr:hypothetical protein [Actinobacteria bacterium ATB1]